MASANQFDLSALQAHNPQSATPASNAGQSSIDNTAQAALNYTMNVPAPPAQDFANQPTATLENPHMEFANMGGGAPDADMGSPEHGGAGKPAVGSDEWHKVRKDNHKEVERRRRETIHEGINELAKIVPGCEKNKGSILQRAVQFIGKLQDDATANIDKWTFEKLVTEQAIQDLSTKLLAACRERDAFKRLAAEAGHDVDAVQRELEKSKEDEDAASRDAEQQNGAVDAQEHASDRRS